MSVGPARDDLYICSDSWSLKLKSRITKNIVYINLILQQYYGENKWGNHHRNISYLFSDIIYYSRISKSCLGAAFLGRCSYISDRHRICNPRTLEPKKTSGSYSFRAQEYSVAQVLMGYFILLNKDPRPSIGHEHDN
jgi:hypothetical protein